MNLISPISLWFYLQITCEALHLFRFISPLDFPHIYWYYYTLLLILYFVDSLVKMVWCQFSCGSTARALIKEVLVVRMVLITLFKRTLLLFMWTIAWALSVSRQDIPKYSWWRFPYGSTEGRKVHDLRFLKRYTNKGSCLFEKFQNFCSALYGVLNHCHASSSKISPTLLLAGFYVQAFYQQTHLTLPVIGV